MTWIVGQDGERRLAHGRWLHAFSARRPARPVEAARSLVCRTGPSHSELVTGLVTGFFLLRLELHAVRGEPVGVHTPAHPLHVGLGLDQLAHPPLDLPESLLDRQRGRGIRFCVP